MIESFQAKKEKILKELQVPDAEYTDLSPKGSVDVEIRHLVDVINAAPGCVTTSSCSGRMVVYLDGPPKEFTLQSSKTASGGKGGGKWMFTSHSPVQICSSFEPGAIYELLGLPKTKKIAFPPSDTGSIQFVHFKFEPMILHILCASTKIAQRVLTAASMSGFRESGISGLYDAKQRESLPMVAVRTSGLSVDSIIGFQNGESEIVPMVTEDYLLTMIRLADERFEKNELRKTRFCEALETMQQQDGMLEEKPRIRKKEKRDGWKAGEGVETRTRFESDGEQDEQLDLDLAWLDH